ncbi:50S ribosome-binding GTPase (macronuclear) [Tetrahymena thermophila SB210]|uniref:50S ribosome-binding GTPase n=1 Tax=Tetrahymena thermophila (strain SB210) TaxID=312017 RepID=I7MKK6_TETTS|nr:50S ribosome-binding GTPase [Tetrahymena thermophila SB210]EAR99463.2 50S ribosome-binding GTPase [Tetrahymena thermophila SB210]|eukprot:XP_001019708.2 50S ribosome-binding GTPase [Tetrahymena thermophila SB210]
MQVYHFYCLHLLIFLNDTHALMIGKTGVGKSYLSNLILGKECFSTSADNTTRKLGSIIRSNNWLTIIKTQGLFYGKQKSKNLLNNIIQIIKDVKGIHKIIFVTQYGSVLDQLSLIILGVLSYCILGISPDLLVIVNKSGREYEYTKNLEQKYKHFGDQIFIKEEQQLNKDISYMYEKIKYWWGKDFILLDVKDFNACQSNEEEEKQKQFCSFQLCQEIFYCSFISQDQVKNWQEFYSAFQKKDIKIQYYIDQENIIREEIKKNSKKMNIITIPISKRSFYVLLQFQNKI